MKNLCIIPARGGSKRIPRKNIKDFHGKPILAWAIELARDCNLFESIIVSTDDHDIASIAKQYGARVPFMRPKSLSDDQTTTLQVMRHVINKYEQSNESPDYICCLYPTSPLLQQTDLKLSLEQLISSKDKDQFCVVVAKFPSEIDRALKLDSNLKLNLINLDNEYFRSQDLSSSYYDAGQFYWARTGTWKSKKSILDDSLGYVIPQLRAIDINSEEDWDRAWSVFSFLKDK